ncbi:uncharacterized protein [Diabrotica undecimpunctata]|uniref:uncharacterized protein n=1 Tax=Diabrotica undecimpunctata TaxID=50387 RepID=UPI003B63A523
MRRILKVIRKYCLVTLIPLLAISSIYADYSHTQMYKARTQNEHVKLENLTEVNK